MADVIQLRDSLSSGRFDTEIKGAYEGNSDTNAFSDAEKNKLELLTQGEYYVGNVTPTGSGDEYPSTVGLTDGGYYFIDIPINSSYTYVGGSLAGKIVYRGDKIIWDTVATVQDWYYIPGASDQGTVWRGVWTDGTYVKNSMITQNGWLMVANKETTDVPAPQENGSPEWGISPEAAFIEASHIGIVKATQTYTMLQDGWLKALQIRVPNWNNIDSVTKCTMIIDNEALVYDNPILSDDGWVTMAVANRVVTIGTSIIVILEMYKASAASKIEGSWNSNIATGVAASQEFNISNANSDGTLVINHIDLNSTNHATALRNVAIGSIINLVESSDNARYTRVETTSVDSTPTEAYSTYTYTFLSEGSKSPIRDGQSSNVTVDVPIVVDSDFIQLADGYLVDPDWATITSELKFDEVVQPNDSNYAYGINLYFQQAYISPDWDALASSDSGGATTSMPFHFSKNDTITLTDSPVLVNSIDIQASAGAWSVAYSFEVQFNDNKDQLIYFRLDLELDGVVSTGEDFSLLADADSDFKNRLYGFIKDLPDCTYKLSFYMWKAASLTSGTVNFVDLTLSKKK